MEISATPPLLQESLNPFGQVEIVDFLLQFFKSLAQMASSIKIKFPALCTHVHFCVHAKISMQH